MTTTSIGRSLGALALAIFAAYAQAHDGTGMQAAALAQPLPTPANCASASLTLPVEAPTGARFQLVFTAGEGWRFVDRAAAMGQIRLASLDDPAPALEGAAATEPQTVFIDGPTGYVFVWIPDHAWQFVGRVQAAH